MFSIVFWGGAYFMLIFYVEISGKHLIAELHLFSYRWVHIVCALYVPGVAFGDIDKLRPVTLTEMNYSKYGAKVRSTLWLAKIENFICFFT